MSIEVSTTIRLVMANRNHTNNREDWQAPYDLKNDVGEAKDVAADHPEIVARLEEAEKARAALGDKLTGQTGSEVRPAGKAKPKETYSG